MTPIPGATQGEPQAPILDPISDLVQAILDIFQNLFRRIPTISVAKEMPQGCLQHTLFDVAISFCSSLDDVMTGTLQNGS
jgi:hypothetical protein